MVEFGGLTLTRRGRRRSLRDSRFARPEGQVAQLVEHGTENARVGGSSPPLTTPGAVAQLGERLHGMQEVVSSNLIGSIR